MSCGMKSICTVEKSYLAPSLDWLVHRVQEKGIHWLHKILFANEGCLFMTHPSVFVSSVTRSTYPFECHTF